jgi:endonuclease/exonuclease/phosphatase family metal-dependent hydrolase
VLSYNVRYFSHATRGIASTATAMQRIAVALARLSPVPDLICLQEVETDSLRSSIAHRKSHPEQTQLDKLMLLFNAALKQAGKPDGYEAYYFPAHAYRLSERARIYTTGLVILAHQDLRIERHNADAPEDITHRRVHLVRKLKQTRICAHLRFHHRNGESIDVFNTHLSLPTTLSRQFWTLPRRMGFGPNQLREAENVVRFVEAERGSDRFLLCGDFNSLPGSPVYRFLLEERGLRDPFAELNGMANEALCAWPTAGFMHFRMHLDHIFSGPALEWLDFADSFPFGGRSSAFHGLSDHMPLIGRCQVKNRA